MEQGTKRRCNKKEKEIRDGERGRRYISRAQS